MEKFDNWVIKKSEEIRIKVEFLLNIWTKKTLQNKPDITKEELHDKQDNKRRKLIQNHKAIMISFCGQKFDLHIIWKSKKLHF
jgi:hypothetical protein